MIQRGEQRAALASAATAVRCLSIPVSLMLLTACSLIEIESPAQPLPERDVNARVFTRDYAIDFGTAVAVQANEVMIGADNYSERVDALRWKLSAASEIVVAATHMSPMVALVDTWTLAAQMDAFLRAEAQSGLFGSFRPNVLATSASLLGEIRSIARRVSTRDEFVRFSELVDAHVSEYPITSINLHRVSLAANRAATSDIEALSPQTVGTAAEAMSDIADRMRLYTVLLRYSTRWQIELIALESGITQGKIADAVESLDASFSELAILAANSPELMSELTADLDRALRGTSGDFERSALAVIAAIRAEREMFVSDFDDRWVDIYDAIDAQRSATATDLERISQNLSESFWANLEGTMREFMVLAIVFMVLLLSLPFAAGYLVGRSRSGPGS